MSRIWFLGLESQKYWGILTSIERLSILGSEGCQLANPTTPVNGNKWDWNQGNGLPGACPLFYFGFLSFLTYLSYILGIDAVPNDHAWPNACEQR
jgi:hypothetical protein